MTVHFSAGTKSLLFRWLSMEEKFISDNSTQQEIVEAMLLPGENIVRVAVISPGVYWKGIAAMIAALFALVYGFWLAVYCAAVGGFLLALAYGTKKYLVLAATDHRIIIRAGILNQEVLQLRYHQVESVDTVDPISGQFFGYGSVIITGTGRARWVVPYVEDPDTFRDHLMLKLIEREEPLVPQAA
jgi:hypothetical protein